MVIVRAPATTANLGPGFDAFGVALNAPADYVTVERARDTSITVTGIGSQYIPEDPTNNVAGVVAEALETPANIHINKGVRPSSGLGSSAASAAGTAVGLNELYDLGATRRELVSAAAEGEAVAAGEPHRDNVAAALLGGFTIAADERIIRVPATIGMVACLPEQTVSTRRARADLPSNVPLGKFVETVTNASMIVAGMTRGDPTTVGSGMDDSVVTPIRARTIDGYAEVKSAALEAGACGVAISGAGPTVVAVCHPSDGRDIAAAMVDGFRAVNVDARSYQTRIGDGATILES